MAGPESNKEVCSLDGAIRQTAQGKDISAKFNAECSPEDRKQVFADLRAASGSPDSKQGTHVSSMLKGFEIGYDSATSKLDYIAPPAGQAKHGPSSHAVEVGDSKKQVAAKTSDTRTQTVPDTGRPGVDDRMSQSTRQNMSYEERQIAKKIGDDLLNGNNVSEAINGLGRDAKVRVMTEIKGHLAEQPGAKVDVSNTAGPDGTRSTVIETAKGQKMLITESNLGIPQDIQFNGGGIKNKVFGSSDLYDRPGETKAESTSSGPSWRDKLLGKPLIEGDGPLARVARGEPITEAERADLEKKRLIYSPKDKTQ
jgi:hypothetical protein